MTDETMDRQREALTLLAYAFGDLRTAESFLKSALPGRFAAFWANQSAQAALRAAFVAADVDAMWAVPPFDWRVSRERGRSSLLSRFGLRIGYPGATAVSLEEARAAVAEAAAVVSLVHEDFTRHGLTTDGVQPQ